MFRSATFKLTISYLAIVVVISLVFSSAVYRIGTNDLAFGLSRETQRITSDFPVFSNSPYLTPSRDLSTGSHRLLARLAAFNVVVIVVAGFASYGLARRTLLPIEQAHEQQKRFTADVSHELRTPLTAMKMEAEVALLDASTSKTELREILHSNLEEIAKLDGLINNLLRLSRLEAGELQQNFETLHSSEILAEAVTHVQKTADSRSISLVTSGDSYDITGDHDSMVQLIVILLDNAIKYSPEKTTITASSRKLKGSVALVVHDQGMGIKPEALEHVFDRFYRADASRTGSSEGFGLGLSIAKLIADVHTASITLASRSGHGTTVTITLPVKDTKT